VRVYTFKYIHSYFTKLYYKEREHFYIRKFM